MKLFLRVFTFAIWSATAFAQDITGTWQGTLQLPANAQRPATDLRIVFKIAKADAGMKATMHSIDQAGAPAIATTVTVQGPTVKLSIPAAAAEYEGKLDSDGVNLIGTWTQGQGHMPLNLKHVTGDAAWPIPEPPPSMKPMKADAAPSFEVATIKPTAPGTQAKGLIMRDARTFMTVNYSVSDLIAFGYAVSPRQIAGGPPWLESDHFDIQGTPDEPGMPNRAQIEGMVQKLLVERFKLTFHREKRELSVFAISVAKTGEKLTPSAGNPNNPPGLGFAKLGSMFASNAKITDLSGLFQSVVLDRPVVDETGLTGHYDFKLNWTPDENQFPGLKNLPQPPPDDKGDAPPDLFTAIQQQLGLKLEAKKAAIDVMVIDHVEKPSAN
jgi:uncharacterized protein (TIGR03435 family)